MQKETITLTLRWPDKCLGFDISQITCNLDLFLRHRLREQRFHDKKAVIDCGSGRKLKIESKKIT